MPCAVGLAGGEAGQGLRAGAGRARRWLPYGFRSGGWAGEQPVPGLGTLLSPGTRFLCVAGCGGLVGDAASFPPRAAPSWEAVFPAAGGQRPPAAPWQAPLTLEGRRGSFPSPKGRAKAEWGEDGCLLLPAPGGNREGGVGAGSPGAGGSGRTVWEGRGNTTGNVRAGGVRGSRRMGGKPLPPAAPVRAAPGWPCVAVSEKPGAGDGRLRRCELQSPAQAGMLGREPHGEDMAAARMHTRNSPLQRGEPGREGQLHGGRKETGARKGMARQRDFVKLGRAGQESLRQPSPPWCRSREAAPSPQEGVAALPPRSPAAMLFP